MRTQRFLMIFSLLSFQFWGRMPESTAQHYAAENGWEFQNFKTAELSWSIFRNSFVAVPPAYDPSGSVFDFVFYDNVYKTKLTKNGNCYGMSLLSLLILKKGGHLGFCPPIPQFSGDLIGILSGGEYAGPSDRRLYEVINQVHGHQVNLPSIKQYIDLVAKGKNKDGDYAFDQVKYYQLRNDPVLVSITKSMSPSDGAHTMAVYQAEQYGPNDKRIFVYDPSRCWYIPTYQSWYTSGNNCVYIKNNHRWEFTKPDGTVWSGDPGSMNSGNITITPISLAGPIARTPSSLNLAALSLANQFFISGNGAALEQVTTSNGKRLFKPGTQDIDNDPATGILSMAPWFPSDEIEGKYDFSLYFYLDPTLEILEFQIRSGDNGYRLDAAGSQGYMRIQSRGGTGLDRLTLQNVGTGEPILALYNTVGAQKFDVDFTQIIQPGKQIRSFQLTDITLARNAAAEFKVTQNRSALEVQNFQTAFTYNLQLRSRNQQEEIVSDLLNLRSEKDQVLLIQPSDWRKPAFNSKEIQLKPTPTPTSTPTPKAGQSITIPIPGLPAGAKPLEMVWIPAGTFTMGSPPYEIQSQDYYPMDPSEETQHQVTLTKSFRLSKYEITQAQWQTLIGNNPAKNFKVGLNYPVYIVSWNDCQNFIMKINQLGLGTFRLPTEAEWEYACRAGTTTRFYWGDDSTYILINDYAWYAGNAFGSYNSDAKEVGLRLPNFWGLYDMSGNVSEWCQDWYGAYSSSPQIDPAGPFTGKTKVARGGDFFHQPVGCRSACRPDYNPSEGNRGIGFRIVKIE